MGVIPSVGVDQMREVDRLMVEEIGVSILMMMENASASIASVSKKILNGNVKNEKIIILCGKGNNGGDGLGAARHLINFGAWVSCFLSTDELALNQNARTQLNILKNIQADIRNYSEGFGLGDFISGDLIIDALIGYNLKGNPREPIAAFIRAANESKKKILAVDIPSGLNGDSGLGANPTIRASATVTLALPKKGLLAKQAKEYVGKLYVADLSVPKIVYEKIGIKDPLVFDGEVVKIS